jgi:hypothetical protein
MPDQLPQVQVIEQYPDGSVMQIGYEDLPLPTNDPSVRSRRRRAGSDPTSEVVTAFAPASERPISFPADLPFIADHAVWTTESPDGSRSTGARWICGDPDAVIAKAVAASLADGWSVVGGTPLSSQLPDAPMAVLRRNQTTRMFLTLEAGDIHVVQLTDVDESVPLSS